MTYSFFNPIWGKKSFKITVLDKISLKNMLFLKKRLAGSAKVIAHWGNKQILWPTLTIFDSFTPPCSKFLLLALKTQNNRTYGFPANFSTFWSVFCPHHPHCPQIQMKNTVDLGRIFDLFIFSPNLRKKNHLKSQFWIKLFF